MPRAGPAIDQHQRNTDDPQDLESIYGRLLWRLSQARLTHGVRAVLWHQGENDQGAAGPTGRYGWETYQQNFIEMSAAWKQDYPNLRQYYVFQIWPNSCSMGRGTATRCGRSSAPAAAVLQHGGALDPGCPPPGLLSLPAGRLVRVRAHGPAPDRAGLLRPAPQRPITPPNVVRAWFVGETRDMIALEFDQPVLWDDSLIGEFYLGDSGARVAAGSAAGTLLTLELERPTTAASISYLNEMSWSQERLLRGKNGMAALTFCNLPIALTN